MNNEFELQLNALLDQAKSKKQINADIKALQTAVNSLKLVATFSKAESKKELNAYIKQLSTQLSTLKLKAKIDNKNFKTEINNTLKNASFKDIDLINIDENKTKLKVRKVIADAQAYVKKSPVVVDFSLKKEKLLNDLTTYLNKNSKISESSVLLNEAEKVRNLIDAIDDNKSLRTATDNFQLFKSQVSSCGFATKSTTDKIKDMLSHVTKIGSVFGIASLAVNQFRQSLMNLKEINTLLTEISKANDSLTKSQLNEIGNNAFDVASKYGKTATDYLTGVQEMSRAGYENAESMAELSVAAQGAGDMTAELANQYIIATDVAFKMNGSIEALTATLDGANNITNHNAVNMTELAEGMSVVGTQAASSQMEVNEITAAIGTMVATTQKSGREMGNAFKGILMNLQQVSGDVGDGEDIIDAESLTKYEKACAELGVSLKEVKNGVVSLKEPMQILKELAEAYTQLDEADAKRANLLSAVGGKYRANALNAILENYDLYEKMLQDYADGIGSMAVEAEKTANSWEGSMNRLGNSIDSFFNSLTNKDAIIGSISFFDKLVQASETLINSLGEVPILLTAINTALVATKKDYGITYTKDSETGKLSFDGSFMGINITAMKDMKKHFAEAEEAMLLWNDAIFSGENVLESFDNELFKNNAQFKAYLSTCSKEAPASLEGYKSYLNAAGVATDGLRLKTVLLNAAISFGIGLAIQAITKAISLAVSAWDHFNVTVKEVQENVDEITSNIKNLNTELDELNSKNNLTDAEQKRLEYLKTRIDLEERLLKIEQARLAQEQLGKSTKFTDWFDEDSYVRKATKEFGVYALDNDYLSNPWFNTAPLAVLSDADAYFNGAEAMIRKGNEQYEQLEYLNQKYEQFVKERDAFDVGSHDWEVGDERVARAASALEAYQKQVTSGSYVDLLNKYGQYTEEVENLQNILANPDFLTDEEIAQSQRLLDLYSSNAAKMKELINNIAISLGDQSLWIGTDLELLDSKTDRLTADTIQRYFTDEEIKVLAYLDFDRDASINTLRSLLKEEQEAADDDPITFSSVLSDESLSKFQSTIDSLKSSLTTLYNGDYSSADLISSLTNINKALTDIGKEKVLNWEEITNIDDLDNIIEQITNEYVDETLESLDMAGTDFGNTIRNVIQEELKASRQLETYKSNVSDLQSAYSNLTDVIETYNANGCITFDQLTSLLEMEPQYLSCLIDENGQLQLNEQAMADLAQLRLDEARTQVVQEAISELNRLSEEKQTQAVNDNSNAYIQNIKTISQWNNALGTAMQNAGLAAPLFAELSSALGGAVSNGASDEAINQVLDNAYKKFQMIGQIQSSIGSNLGGVLGKASSSSGTASSSTDTYEEQFDFFERRVEVLDNAVSLLKANLENLTGSFAKNQLLDQNSNILEERMRNYSDAVRMYQEKAQEALSKLDQETQKKIIDGSVSLTDYIGEENKAVVEAMDDYKGWSDKVAECTEELASLKEELRQLELEKLNHIIQDFSDQFDLRDKAKDLIDKQIALFEEAGQLIGKAFYEEQIDQSQKQLSLLEDEKAQLVNQLSSAISSGRVQKGTEEWLEMVNALSDVDDSILDCKKSIEEFDNAILNLHWETFDRVQDTFESLSDEISNLIGVMDDADVATIDNQWTKEGLTQLGLYAQQYELATYQVSQYADEIDKLSADYLLGKYSATEYADKLADLNSAQWDAVNAAESAKASIMDLNEARVNIVVEGIREEIDAYKELIDSQITALDAEKDLHEYQNSIAEKSNNIAKLEKQLAAMQNDNTAAAIAKRKQLEEQLAEAKADLDQTQYEHSVETQKEALNQRYQDYEDARNKEIEALEATLKDKENIIASSMESVKQHTQVIATQITDIANQHGVNISNALTSSWASGENAIASYGEVLSQGTSMFIENIMGIENQIYQLQVNADVTAISLANMFSANADNLVNELNTSYFAESNLLSMTNALHNSLINTLQGGYDVSSIVNSLNAVTDAANKARAATSSIGNSNISTTAVPAGFNDLDAGRKYFVKDDNNKTLFVGSPSQCQSWVSAHNYSLGSISGDDIHVIDNNKKIASYASSSISSAAISIGQKAPLKKYASGAKNIEEDQLAITNEAGQELVYHAADGSILTPLQPGDKVFENEAVNRLWQLGHGIVPPDMTKNLAIPTMLPNNVNNNSVNNYFDSMFKIEGDVIDADRITKRMEKAAIKIADQRIDKSWREFSNELRYGGCASVMHARR